MSKRSITARRENVPVSKLSEIERFAMEFRLDQKPGFLFRRLDNRAVTLFQKVTGQTDISTRQFGVLLILFQNGRMTQSALGNQLSIDRSTMGEMLQRMVDRGLVRRRILRSDRRTAELWISTEGKQVLLATVKQADAAQQMLIAVLPDEYRPLFLKCLCLLAEAEPAESEG